MQPKVGDRVSLDAKKVGQPRRFGDVVAVSKGLTAMRFGIRWEDGSESVIAPSAGTLLIEGKSSKKAASKAKAAKPKAKAAKAKPKAKAAKPKAKAKAKAAKTKAKPKAKAKVKAKAKAKVKKRK
jgi:hypothetical protein